MKVGVTRTWMGWCGALLLTGGAGCASEQQRELAEAEANTQINIVARAIDVHRARQSSRELPDALAELVESKELLDKQIIDPWGRPLRYVIKGPGEFELCSAGPDEASAADDICRAAR